MWGRDGNSYWKRAGWEMHFKLLGKKEQEDKGGNKTEFKELRLDNSTSWFCQKN